MKNLRLFWRNRGNECEALWPLLSAYSDGETTDSETWCVEAHLAECKDCASALEVVRQASASLSLTEEVAPPGYLRGAILAATTSLDAASARHPVRAPLRVQWGFGAAAMAGILAAVVYHANMAPTELAVAPLPSVPHRHAMVKPQVTPPALSTVPVRPPASNEVTSMLNQPQVGPAMDFRSETPRRSEIASAIMRRPTDATEILSVPKAARVTRPAIAAKTVGSPAATTAKASPMAPTPVVEVLPNTPMENPVAPPESKEEPTPAPAPAETPVKTAETIPPAEPPMHKILLTAESRALPLGQVASLADLKRSLRQQGIQWNRSDAMRGLNERQISVGIVKRSF